MPRLLYINRTDIHEAAVQSYIRAGGEVNNLLTDIARTAKNEARLYLIGQGSYRSGRLIGGLNNRRAVDTGPLSAASRIGSSAKHTDYYMYDTGPVITGGKYGYMLVPKHNKKQPHMSPATKGAGSELFIKWVADGKPRKRPFKRRTEVRGYKGRPFLRIARDAAFVQHGFPPPR